MNSNSPKIIPFSFENSMEIKRLNMEWLEKYFEVEESDKKTLSNPQLEIIDKGGHIFYVTFNNEIVGTASLLKIKNTIFELSKMAVTEKAQGMGIGKLLMEHCIIFSKENGIKKLILFSNTILIPAIKMYEKFGFKEIPLETSIYKRSNIKMEKEI